MYLLYLRVVKIETNYGGCTCTRDIQDLVLIIWKDHITFRANSIMNHIYYERTISHFVQILLWIIFIMNSIEHIKAWSQLTFFQQCITSKVHAIYTYIINGENPSWRATFLIKTNIQPHHESDVYILYFKLNNQKPK